MKLYIITNEPFPHGMASTNRIHSYAKGVSENGMECEVLIYHRTEFPEKVVNTQKEGIISNNFKYKYIGDNTIRDKNIFIRKYNDIKDLFLLCLFVLNKISKGDIILFYFSSIILEFILISLSHFKGIKVLREFCEYPYVYYKPSISIKIKQYIELNFVFPLYDGFLSISHSLFSVAEKHKSIKAKNLLIPILIKTDIGEVDTIKEIKCPYIFHGGTLTQQKDGFLEMLEAFAIASKQLINLNRIEYVICGNIDVSPIKREILDIIEKYKIQDRVKFLGILPHKEMLKWLYGAELLVLNKPDTLQNKYGFSTKLGDYLLSGNAVITTEVGEANYYLKDEENAYIVSNGDSMSLSKKIIEAFTQVEKRNKIGLAGKITALENFDCIKQGKRLVDFCNQLGKL